MIEISFGLKRKRGRQQEGGPELFLSELLFRNATA
jgi:hypothetical protein